MKVPQNGHNLICDAIIDKLAAEQDAVVVQPLVNTYVAMVVWTEGGTEGGRVERSLREKKGQEKQSART
jgi:hypothetical protein